MSNRIGTTALVAALFLGLAAAAQAITLADGQSITVGRDGHLVGHGIRVSSGRSFALDGGGRPLQISIQPGEGVSIALATSGTGLKIARGATFLIYPDGQVVENNNHLKENPNVTIDREGEILAMVLAPGQSLALARDGLLVVTH